jgi:hypothetical protein
MKDENDKGMDFSEIRPSGTLLNKEKLNQDNIRNENNISIEKLIKEVDINIINIESNIKDLQNQLEEIKHEKNLIGSHKIFTTFLIKEKEYLKFLKDIKQKLIDERIKNATPEVLEFIKKIEKDMSNFSN